MPAVKRLPPPPRTIHPTHPAPVLRIIALALLVLVCLATAAMLAALAHEGIVRGLGRVASAQLISIHERKSGGSYYHVARYRYTLGDTSREDDSRISWAAWHRLREPLRGHDPDAADFSFLESGATLNVLAYDFGPLHFSRAVEHQWDLELLLIPAIFGPTLLLLSSVLYLAIIIRPRRVRWLYTHGTATEGTIDSQRTVRAKHAELYFADYTFRPPGMTPQTGTVMLAGAAEQQSAGSGSPVTVLYDPTNPRRNTVYEYGGYTCDSIGKEPPLPPKHPSR